MDFERHFLGKFDCFSASNPIKPPYYLRKQLTFFTTLLDIDSDVTDVAYVLTRFSPCTRGGFCLCTTPPSRMGVFGLAKP
jgi:hypothetical protein